MRYPITLIPGLPTPADLNLGISLTPIATANAAVTATPTVELSVVSAASTVTANIGGAAVPLSLTLTNDGATDGGGAVVTAPWLADTADRTFGALTVTASAGVVLGAFDKADLEVGAVVTTWPAGGTIDIAVDVSALAAFVESFVANVVPVSGTAEMSPADNTDVVTAVGAAASASIVWQDFITPTNTSTSITAGVQELGADINFCGDGFTQARTGGGSYVNVTSCPPAFNIYTGARWQIQIVGYNAANAYTVSQDLSGLSPAAPSGCFTPTQTADIIEIATTYALLGSTAGDGIEVAGNAIFEVFENAVSIGTVTLTLVAY